MSDEAEVPDDAPQAPPLTREAAQQLRARWPRWSPWSVVRAQLAAALVCVLLWSVASGGSAGMAALYAAISVVLPQAVMTWGVSRREAPSAPAALAQLLAWQGMKVIATLVLCTAVVMKVQHLHWVAWLLTLVVCLKVHALVLLKQGRAPRQAADGI